MDGVDMVRECDCTWTRCWFSPLVPATVTLPSESVERSRWEERTINVATTHIEVPTSPYGDDEDEAQVFVGNTSGEVVH